MSDQVIKNAVHPNMSAPFLAQEIVLRPIESLVPSPHNAKIHTPKQIGQIAASIRQFGFLVPVLIDEVGQILAGHGRVEAAKSLGMDKLPTIRVEYLSPAEKRAYLLADNKIAANTGFNEIKLAEELSFLVSETIELDFDVEITGFETPEIDLLIDGPPAKKPKADPDDLFQPASGPAVSRPGDLWLLGPHRLLCGDALDPASYEALMGRDRAQMVISDFPYNIPIQGHVGGSGRIQHREFVQASGEMSDAEFTDFLKKACRNLAAFSQDGSLSFLYMDWRHIRHLLEAAEPVFGQMKQLLVWNKGSGGMGSFYRSAHELILVFKNGRGEHINNFGLGEKGRYRTNVWDYAGVNSFGSNRLETLALHPTVKPTAMIADALRDCSHRNGLVLDPFAGSGTILLAAEKTGRIARAMELDPLYVDTAIQRWQAKTKQPVTHAETGLPFEQIRDLRFDELARTAWAEPVFRPAPPSPEANP